jgi:hypothetical protein
MFRRFPGQFIRFVPLSALDANGLETMDTALENGYNNAGNW